MSRPAKRTRADRWTAFGYLGLAQGALLAAAAVTLWDPATIAGFFYHPKMIAAVHTVTLGWISSSLIGLLYLASRETGLRARWIDVAILAGWAAGSSGLASHFWIESYGGMTWSAGLLGLAIVIAAGRFGMTLATARIDTATRLQLNLGWLNLIGTAAIGLLIGFNKTTAVLPGYSLHNVFGHVHLAALGWAGLLVFGWIGLAGAGKPPTTVVALRVAGTLGVQVGAAGIFVSFLIGDPRLPVFCWLSVAGLLLCALGAGVQLPGWRRSVTANVAMGAVWLVVALVIGLGMLPNESPVAEPGSILTYGVFGLLGGLGQTVLGLVWSRLDRSGARPALPWLAAAGWSAAVPLLAFGLRDAVPWSVRAGAAALALAVAATSLETIAAARED